MKNRKKKTKNTGFYICIFLIPLIIALIVFAQVVISGVSESAVSNDGLTLEIVGIAISVWVGLNIYNVIVREDVNSLIEDAQEANMLAERLTTESFISKLRTSYSEDTVVYISSRVRELDPLPSDLVTEFLEIEDMLNLAYKRYTGGQRTLLFDEQSARLASLLERYERDYKRNLRSDQRNFVSGYLRLRYSDFKYFALGAMEKKGTFKERCDLAREAEDGYKECLKQFLNISFPVEEKHAELL